MHVSSVIRMETKRVKLLWHHIIINYEVVISAILIHTPQAYPKLQDFDECCRSSNRFEYLRIIESAITDYAEYQYDSITSLQHTG